MKIGIKIGPDDGIKIISKVKAKYCEVWFRLDYYQKYISLFKYLKKNKISFGLHFWAMVDGKYFPDLLFLNKKISKKTFNLIKQTIDIAHQWQAYYVNFHPESYRLNLLDLNRKKIKTLNPHSLIKRKKSFKQLIFYLAKIKEYSEKKKVLALIETVPKFMPSGFADIKKERLKPQKSEGLETEKFIQLIKLGHKICFDIGHTLGQLVSDDRKKLFNYLYQSAKQMALGIKLIHVTTNIPPFNGTDSHNGILEEDFKEGVLPTKVQLIKLLNLFKNKDVWLIPEPPIDKMKSNYFALKKIVNKIEAKF